MITEAFKPVEMLGTNYTQEDLEKAFENLKTLSGTEGDELKKVAKAQEAYAAANNFTIESPEEGE